MRRALVLLPLALLIGCAEAKLREASKKHGEEFTKDYAECAKRTGIAVEQCRNGVWERYFISIGTESWPTVRDILRIRLDVVNAYANKQMSKEDAENSLADIHKTLSAIAGADLSRQYAVARAQDEVTGARVAAALAAGAGAAAQAQAARAASRPTVTNCFKVGHTIQCVTQ